MYESHPWRPPSRRRPRRSAQEHLEFRRRRCLLCCLGRVGHYRQVPSSSPRHPPARRRCDPRRTIAARHALRDRSEPDSRASRHPRCQPRSRCRVDQPPRAPNSARSHRSSRRMCGHYQRPPEAQHRSRVLARNFRGVHRHRCPSYWRNRASRSCPSPSNTPVHSR